jgi:8-oxo-dGTP diphosphatase
MVPHTHPHPHVTESSRHLTASMVVFDLGRAAVLLVHHNATGRWVFPGGHVDPDEAPGEAAIREVVEETGIRPTIAGRPDVHLPGMTWHPSPWLTAEIPAPAKPERPGKPAEPAHTHVDLLFVGTADSTAHGLTAALDEVSGARWVPLPDLEGLDVRAEVPGVVRAAYMHLVLTQLYPLVDPGTTDAWEARP